MICVTIFSFAVYLLCFALLSCGDCDETALTSAGCIPHWCAPTTTDHITADLSGLRDAIATQAPQSPEFARSLQLIVEQTTNINLGIQELRDELKKVRLMVADLGDASRAVLASNEALGGRVSALHSEMEEHNLEMAAVRNTLAQLQSSNSAVRNSLDALLLSAYKLPTLVVAIPHLRKKMTERFDPTQLFQDVYNLHFICSYTLRVSPKGFKIPVTKAWVSHDTSNSPNSGWKALDGYERKGCDSSPNLTIPRLTLALMLTICNILITSATPSRCSRLPPC